MHPANLLDIDYASAAADFAPPPAGGIIDVHCHINGPRAAQTYLRACDLYGISRSYSMTPMQYVDDVRRAAGDRIRFIAVPNYRGENRRHDHGRGFIEQIGEFHARGARIVKFWAAPRGIDYGHEAGDPGLLRLDAPGRVEAMERAASLGMIFMTHVADPDTWFVTKYADSERYGTKAQQYEPLERLLDRFDVPWIAAHMGGWPEDLAFLAGLLERHDNLYLDTSAAKWMIRELSRQPRDGLIAFLERFDGRILFGSDIVADDEHFTGGKKEWEVQARASNAGEAFDLYASRYWALRTLWETDYRGPSPIADPDLAMVDPDSHDPMDAPELAGKSVPARLLENLYGGAARALLGE